MPRTTFITSAHILKNNTVLVLLMMSAGGGGLFISLMLGASVVIGTIAFMVPMIILALRFSGKAEYAIDESGVSRTVVTTLGNKHSLHQKTWAEIKYFKVGSDLNRSLKEYNFLELTFFDGEVWKITDDRSDKEAFLAFKESFQSAASSMGTAQENLTESEGSIESSEVTARESNISETILPIKQRKTFYETLGAQVLFWGMAIFLAALAIFYILYPEYMNTSNAFRISFILIPGIMYLYYRLYRKRK